VAKTSDDDEHPLGGFAKHKACCSVDSVTSFKEGGCRVTLPGSSKSAGTCICLSGTAYQDEHKFHDKLCDLMFAWEQASGTKVSAPIELKGGHVDVSHVRLQLQNGADIIDALLKDIKVVSFIPVLVHETISPTEKRKLLEQRVSFRGKKILITRVQATSRIDALPW
jgi:hypothetical protein